MTSNHTISIEENPSPADLLTIENGLTTFNDAQAEPENWRTLAVIMRDSNGVVVAGLNGATQWNWLYIIHLWVSEPLRGQGYGRQIMILAEQEAVKRGCRFAHLETIDFQALPFYQKMGYEIFASLQDYPPGHVRYSLAKRSLSDNSAEK